MVKTRQQMIFHRFKNIVVRIPTVLIGFVGRRILTADIRIPKHCNPGHFSFNQSAGKQASLTRTISTIAIANRILLLGKIKRTSSFRVTQNLIRLLVTQIMIKQPRHRLPLALFFFQRILQGLPLLNSHRG